MPGYETLRGSCLCGAVTYEVRAPFIRFAHCHCARCRKKTGSAHATNLYVAPDHFRWTAGQELTRRWDLPTAKSFATTVCTRCGGPMPHLTRSGREMVIPAGTLDDVPSISPRGRIYWASRAPWSCDGDDLPRSAEYPEWW